MKEPIRHLIAISKAKCLGFTAFSLAMVLFDAYLVAAYFGGKRLDGRESFLLILSPIGLPVFIFATFIHLRLLFDPRAGLLFSEEGLYYNTGIAGGTYVKWEEVSAIHLTTNNHGPKPVHTVEVRTQLPEGFSTIAAPRAPWRWIFPKCKFRVYVASNTLSASHDQIVEAFRSHQPHPVIDERKYY